MNTISSNVSNAPEHNEQYDTIGQELYFRLYQYDIPPGYKIEFKGDFGQQHKIENYYMPGVREAFQDYIWKYFGLKIGYEHESRGFGLRIQDYDITGNGYSYMVLKKHLNSAVDFMVDRLQNRGEVVFDHLESRPSFFNKIIDQLLRSIGYTARFVTQGSSKRMLIEKHTDTQNIFGHITTEIEDLQQLKALLDEQQSHKVEAEAVETEFSKSAIEKLKQTDSGVILITNEMMSDDGFPSLVTTIKQLAKNPDKNIQVFAVDEIPAELGLHPVKPGNIIIGSPYKTRNEAGVENIKTILGGDTGGAYKKKLYGANKITTFITYGHSEQEQTIVKFLKLLVFQKGLFPGHQVVE